MEIKEYISLEVLAVTLKLPQSFLRQLTEKKLIPFLDVNGRFRFNPETVQQALDDLARKGGENK